MRIMEGQVVARDLRFVIVAARFNDLIVRNLVDGAVDTLKRHGAAEGDIHVVRVPGAFELPLAAQRLARLRRYDAIVALGAVIRGQTPHFDFVCTECATGLGRVSLEFEVPVGFGVLTCDTVDQAMDRAGGKSGNKGADAVLAALEMASLLRQLEG
ncbi:MAG: 6,7-dimethyl-8-ribityllumazine synthase [Gammaproteobacteria bacterium]|jgi:6,7-dimethyl-8-ribityllumazine synthase|nr:6,7-dimethyl-8-ribityllumazine synthase [Gammaproteobacteria bacterium]